MDMWPAQVHPIALNRTRDTANKHDRPIRLRLFDHPDMCKRVVELAVSVEVPCIIKEHQVAGVRDRSLVKCAVSLDVRIDQFDPVGSWVTGGIAVEINPVLQEDGARDAGAVIGNLLALAGDGPCPDELRRGERNG